MKAAMLPLVVLLISGVTPTVAQQQPGVAPDLGNRKLVIVPQLPPGQDRIAGRAIRVGDGTVAVSASRRENLLVTEVEQRGTTAQVTIGAVLPEGSRAAGVTLNGRPVTHQLVRTARGEEVRVAGTGRLEIGLG